ncbi:MAG TPA: rhamnulose-1-phosphate aldolase [Acholeplasmataceae bacterium]|jgi:rhamnulose-1-phosphate aldolase|nr:rhamnulose-1-phosphate aldolase [Acholeplasmataceae bacterium]
MINNSKIITELTNLIDLMYQKGWHERNAGNISYLLFEEELKDYLKLNSPLRNINLTVDASSLAGKFFLVTGSGKYFKNVKKNPETNLGIIRINEDGKTASLLWGLEDGGAPTSELSSHLLSHTERLKIDSKNRVVVHTHATNLIAMSIAHDLDEEAFSKTLWRMNTECIIVFPEGIGILPWMVCGNEEIGYHTAKKFQEYRLVLWPMHGVFGVGNSLDDVFGLIETAEKAAGIYLKAFPLGIKNLISDEQLIELTKAFGIKPNEKFIKIN